MEELIWGRRIRAFRKLKGFTQEEFAKMLGISVSVLGEVERGTREPGEDLLMRVIAVLNVTYDELTSIK
ncbi:helix-turn-helix domain-containing protein [Salipaludibacillus sp. LMS25]|uniref:helix-turn-helix domain-containing protein n=1 Tax=Salipaludibacillus sp. LMS25 TaxID=2924031 RepID=UPI0020D0BD44|nr:helix-turn-helix transcriptional regulator [Salipaludibacillus sp. LMS25]UTR16681.1 helix-turn-helix domain-containing protein [Salipaludibacillus sp. LMS25]